MKYCLKILCLYGVVSVVCAGAVIGGKDISETIYKKYLKLRTLSFQDCGSEYDILYLNINSCSKLPCEMPLGSFVVVNVLFDDNGDNPSMLKHTVRWVFNAVRTDAKITPDPCDGHHKCLFNDTEGKSYWATVYVDKTLPTISGTMLWEVVNEKNSKVMCFKVPVVISTA